MDKLQSWSVSNKNLSSKRIHRQFPKVLLTSLLHCFMILKNLSISSYGQPTLIEFGHQVQLLKRSSPYTSPQIVVTSLLYGYKILKYIRISSHQWTMVAKFVQHVHLLTRSSYSFPLHFLMTCYNLLMQVLQISQRAMIINLGQQLHLARWSPQIPESQYRILEEQGTETLCQ